MSTSESRETPPPIEHFDAGKAVRRLLAGEPPQYIFGENYVLLTTENLGAVLRPDPATRKVRFTLATAALMDAAQIIYEMPEKKLDMALPSINTGAITPHVLQASISLPFLEYTYKETRESIKIATDPRRTESTLSRALAKIRKYLPILDDEEAHFEIENLLASQLKTIERFLPAYYQLLSAAYQNKFGVYPPFSSFQNMAENSIGILGRISAQGLMYMAQASASLMSDDNSFDPEKFNLLEQSNGKLVLLVKGSVSKRINTTHKSLPSTYDRAMINCPANVVGINYGDQPRTSHSFIEAVNLRALSHLKEATFP